jgi:hypothetical protein
MSFMHGELIQTAAALQHSRINAVFTTPLLQPVLRRTQPEDSQSPCQSLNVEAFTSFMQCMGCTLQTRRQEQRPVELFF